MIGFYISSVFGILFAFAIGWSAGRSRGFWDGYYEAVNAEAFRRAPVQDCLTPAEKAHNAWVASLFPIVKEK